MDYKNLILMRESCRNYKVEPVTGEQLEFMFDAARLAPSACNSQPWEYIAVVDPALRQKVAQFVQEDGINGFTDKAAAMIVALEIPAKLSPRLEGTMDSQHFAQIDIGLSVMQLCLAATSLGLGTCILGCFNEEKIKNLLGIPDDKRVRLVVSVGHPADDTPRKKRRKSMEETVRYV